MTQKGQPILYRTSTSGYHAGYIAGNITNGGDTADIVALTNGVQWEDTGNDYDTTINIFHAAKNRGTGVGEWVDNPDPTDPPDLSGRLSASLSPSTPSRTLGTAFQPSSTRPVDVSYSGRVSCTSTLLGGQAGRLELLSDASNPPTTVRSRVACALSGVAATNGVEAPLQYRVPTGHYVLIQSVTETGTPSFTLNTQVETPL